MSEDEASIVYALRVTAHARAGAVQAWEFFARTAGEEKADAWQDGLVETFASLSRLPARHPIAPEAPLFGQPPVRRLIFRLARTGPAYHIYFRIFGFEEARADAPFVRILAIRHAAMAPLGAQEAQDITDAEA